MGARAKGCSLLADQQVSHSATNCQRGLGPPDTADQGTEGRRGLVQVAKWLGAHVTAVTRAASVPLVRSLAADEVIITMSKTSPAASAAGT